MSSVAQSPEPFTADSVRNARFQLIRRGGYDPSQVDAFLERLAQALESDDATAHGISSTSIHQVRFSTVRRGGYLPDDVDAFLDRAIDRFLELEMSSTNQTSVQEPVDLHEGASADAADDDLSEIVDSDVEPADTTVEAAQEADADGALSDDRWDVAPESPPVAEAPYDADEPNVEFDDDEEPEVTEDLEAAAQAADVATEDSSPEAHLERLERLHAGGVLSDLEFAVLRGRVNKLTD